MIINVDDGQRIVVVGDQSADSALNARGIDPDSVEYQVTKSPQKRLNDLETANGVGVKDSKRGIAQRIDNLEDELDAIKDEIGMS